MKILFFAFLILNSSCSSTSKQVHDSVINQNVVNQGKVVDDISNTGNLKNDYNSSLASMNRLREITDKRSFDYEVALSEAIIDIKHVTLEALNQGNSYMALYHINEGTRVAPFRGDLLDLKKKTIDEYIAITNQYSQSSDINCETFDKRYLLLKKIAPDFGSRLKRPREKCPEKINLDIKSDQLSFEDLVKDLPVSTSGEKSRYLNFVTYDFPRKELFIESMKRLKELKFESTFVRINKGTWKDHKSEDETLRDVKLASKMWKNSPELARKLNDSYAYMDGLSVMGEVVTKGWFVKNTIEDNFCERIAKILSYEGENAREAQCGNIRFTTTPLAKSEIKYLKGFLPPNLVYKIVFYLPNRSTETFYASGKQDMIFDKFEKYFLDEVSGADQKKLVNFHFNFYANSPYVKHNEIGSFTSSNGIGSIDSSFILNIPLMKKTNAQDAVGFVISFDPENTLKFIMLEDGQKDIKKYIGNLNK